MFETLLQFYCWGIHILYLMKIEIEGKYHILEQRESVAIGTLVLVITI